MPTSNDFNLSNGKKQPGEDAGKNKVNSTGLSGPMIGVIILAAVAGNIFAAKRFRASMAEQVARHSARTEAEEASRVARER
ncbi:unnamed protein product, partial [Choristocarpus tenellus]